MKTPHRQADRSRGQRLSVDRAGLGHAGQQPGCARGSFVVVVVKDHTLRVRVHRIAMVVGSYGQITRVRLWMGRAFGRREVRWSHTAREIPAIDVERTATPREVDLGRIA
jgi:hypothetical protein